MKKRVLVLLTILVMGVLGCCGKKEVEVKQSNV